MFHLKSCFILSIVFLAFSLSFGQEVDATGDGGVITSIPNLGSVNERIEKLIDDDPNASFITEGATDGVEVQYHATKIYVITKYAITAWDNYFAKSYPEDWTIFGSSDGGYTWIILDEKTGQEFTAKQRREFTITNTNKFRDFKISFGKPKEGVKLQLAELEIIGQVSGGIIPHSEFTVNDSVIFLGESVTFTNNSTNANEYLWTFEGGTPATSTDENPTVVYNTVGVHEAKLQSSSSDAIDIKFIQIDVRDPNVIYPENITADGGRINGIAGDIEENNVIGRLIDKELYASFISITNSMPVIFQYEATKNYILTSYKLTSPAIVENDPVNWTIYGSSDGIVWNSLDSRENETFSGRIQTKEYTVTNTSEYRFYKIEMSNSNSLLALNEIELWGENKGGDFPVAHFTSKTTRIKPGESVTFINKSNNATSYSWTFEGGTPATSTDENPTITFNDTGYFNVTLKAIKDGLIDSKIKQKNIGVYTPGDWADFEFPLIILLDEDNDHPGSILFHKLAREKGYASIEDYIQQTCLLIAKKIYYSAEDANAHNLDTITYKITDGNGVSGMNGLPPSVFIFFNLNYLVSYAERFDEDIAFTELTGILCHELTHCYQRRPHNSGDYFSSKENSSLAEGIADLVRLLLDSYYPARTPTATDPITEERPAPWLAGYTVTGFFYMWLSCTQVETSEETFLIDLNMASQNLPVWNHDNFCQYFFNRSIEDMWTQYQKEIPNFPWDPSAIISEDFNSPKNALSKQCQILPNLINSLINYSIPAEGIVKLEMIDLKGRLIATLIDSHKKQGNYSVNFNNNKYSSGIYYFRLSVGKSTVYKKAVLIK